ncbi:hypothetical protein [Streptococcus parasanguinis]|uniref:hypothetical protein n=1 Tax=Streptococcus parasanguinis TaxID=1318 RepID=UPI0020C864DB|nr:hypothetical protein [Streptococcus parasanguinis]MCP8989836.1 hypothetical protein [Streptococcus parasanguinis]MCP8992227.1 hypothetical protein [Streptococcus parasanguinis]MCP9002571.1 hypothetical protein [Streptococcus parasanguinis]MCP9008885.1 hypothetical protein [Streptococcus parasanguinis]MCP9033807.1 hypothetical protein [Streptococcus parasanguinis]
MNLKIMKAPYLAVMEWEVEEGKLDEAAKIWTNSKVSNFFENSVLYKGLTKNSLVVLYEVTNFSVIQQFVESDEFKQFVKTQAKYMQSDFHQSIVGLVEDVIRRKQLIPKTKYMQLRSIEVPLSDIDSYLEWRKRRIFEFVKRNDKVTSFLAFHSVFSTVPGVLFVTEFEGNPDEYRASFLTDEYKQIIKEAGHDHIKSGEQGLQTFEYEKVE